MKHRVAGRKLGRTSAHRLAVLRNLSAALFVRERITTTLGKAKELRPFAEKLVTLAKRETLHARRQVLRHIPDRDVVAKLFDTISARFAQRPGGYTRIVKLGPRRGDNAEMAIVELVGFEPTFTKKKGAEAKGKGKAKAKAGKDAPPAESAEPESKPKAERRSAKKRKDKEAAADEKAPRARRKASETKEKEPSRAPARKKASAAKKGASKATKRSTRGQ